MTLSEMFDEAERGNYEHINDFAKKVALGYEASDEEVRSAYDKYLYRMVLAVKREQERKILADMVVDRLMSEVNKKMQPGIMSSIREEGEGKQ